MNTGKELTAPVIRVSRLRMGTDGEGITSLVCFHGCPLRCRYCLNPFTIAPDTAHRQVSPEELLGKVEQDSLYYLATGGGVTFGGGEPLLRAAFIRRFREICPEGWHLCAETSLAVPWEQVELAASCVDMFFVDCKDTNPRIYRAYTGQDNTQMLENLRKLIALVGEERILVRLPLIPGYNTEADRVRSRALLEAMGITQFDCFTYRTPFDIDSNGA